ncbi:MAG TPA: DUF1579 family protein [Polyangia bacterium]|jgi:hypothetical protein|nr:DUF1579 family protein [Polyangia bacterium]
MKASMLALAASMSVSTLAIAGGDDAKGPKPAPEIAERAKVMAGRWKCEGTSATMDGKEARFTGSLSSKLELDGYWVHESFDGTVAGGKFKFETYATFDASAKKWRNLMLDNWGGSGVGTSEPMKAGKSEVVYETVGLAGKSMVKSHLDVSDPKKGVRLWGEFSMDGGKTWIKNHDMMCKK